MSRIDDKHLCAALDAAAALRPAFDEIARRFDAVLTPSAPGEAPVGLASTGDSIFNGLWTLLHVPCISLPGLTGPHGLPLGVQLVAPRYSDSRLLGVAALRREAVARLIEECSGFSDSGAGHHSGPEAHAEARDLAWSGDPEVLAMLQHIVRALDATPACGRAVR